MHLRYFGNLANTLLLQATTVALFSAIFLCLGNSMSGECATFQLNSSSPLVFNNIEHSIHTYKNMGSTILKTGSLKNMNYAILCAYGRMR